MPRKDPLKPSSFLPERGEKLACSIIRLFRSDGAERATATVVVVGRRKRVIDQLTDVLVDAKRQVLHVDSTESVGHVLAVFPIDVVIFSTEIARLQIASLIESMKGRSNRPELFALVENALDGAWLSHFGVTSLPKWSDYENVRGAVFRRLERAP
jgi:hypothetical protein